MKRFGKWIVWSLAVGVAVCVGCRSLEEEPLFAGCASSPALTLYVATDGSDAWTGRPGSANGDRSDGPLATLEAARQRIRELKAKGPLPAGGVEVVLRGGRRISGWKKQQGGALWTAEVADAKGGGWRIAQLFVGGQPRSRTRLPKKGSFSRVTGRTRLMSFTAIPKLPKAAPRSGQEPPR